MRNKVIFTTILAFFVLIFANSAYAATINVNPGDGTISNAITGAHDGDTLNLTTGNYTDDESIKVGKNLTITGAGSDSTFIDGKDDHTVFHVEPGYTVLIQNLCIQNGKASQNGGGIYNEGNLILNNCEICYNQAAKGDNARDATPGGDGGAVYNTNKGNLTAINCYIHDNNAGKGGDANGNSGKDGESKSGGNGGAIYNAGILNLQNCDIEYNNAGDGGDGSRVHDGSSGGSGGAIYNAAGATLTIEDNCSFYHNCAGDGGENEDASRGGAGGNGGAIFNDENAGTVLITDSIINANNAGNGHHGGDAGNGGAIYNRGVITLEDCEIDANHAGNGGSATGSKNGQQGGSGGAIYNEADDKDRTVSTVLTLINCELSDNWAGDGGSASNDNQGGAGGNGGAIYNGATLTVEDGCEFDDNYTGNGSDSNNGAEGASGGDGGAIYNLSGATATISNSQFDGNYAGNGGDGTDTRNGRDGGNGGAIYNNGIFIITNTSLTNNKGGKGGSIGELPLDALSGGNGGDGGAIYNDQKGDFTITNCTLTKNEAGSGGDSGDLTSDAGNGGDGGAIYNNGKLLINQGTVIDRNLAGIGGGVLQISEFDHNLPWGDGGNGGAIYNDDEGVLTINETIITNNRARIAGLGHSAGDGGAIYNTGSLNITQSELRGNMAGVDVINAFAKYFAEKYDVQWLFNVQIDYGKGNGIYSDTDDPVAVNFCSFEDEGTFYIDSDLKPKDYIEDVYLNGYNSSKLNLQNNWWGINNSTEIANLVRGKNDLTNYYTPYLVLNITADPNPIKRDQTSTVTSTLIMNSAGQNTKETYNMTVPDGVKVTFRVLRGTLSTHTTTTTSGVATTIFTPAIIGDGRVYARVGRQVVSVNISKVKSANVALKMNATLTQYDYNQDTIEYLITATNYGPNEATGLIISDPIPSGTTLSSYYVWNLTTHTWDQLSAGYDPATGNWTIGSLPIGRTAQLKILVTVNPHPATITINNTAKRTAQNEDNSLRSSVTTKTKVLAQAAVVVDNSVNVTTQNVGQNIVYTLTATNGGPENATNIKITDILPAGLTFVSAVGDGSYSAGVWTINQINAFTSAVIHITATVTSAVAGTTVNNTATLSQLDQYDSNIGMTDNASFYVPIADAGVFSEFWSADNWGSAITNADYLDKVIVAINLYNNGPDADSDLVVSDILPTGLNATGNWWVSWDNGQSWVSQDASFDPLTGNWTVNHLGWTDSFWLAIEAQVVDSDTRIENNASIVEADVYDPNTVNNESTAYLNVSASADIYITMNSSNVHPYVEDVFHITIKVGNNGPDSAGNVKVTLPVPADMEFLGFLLCTQGTPNYDSTSKTITWDLGDLGSVNQTLLFNLRAINVGISLLDANVTSNTYDYNLSNNKAMIDVLDVPSADAGVFSEFWSVDNWGSAINTANYLDKVIAAINLYNNGPDADINVVVSDILPAGLSATGNWWVSWDNGQSWVSQDASFDPLTGNWTVNHLGLFDSFWLAIEAQVVDSDTRIENNASIVDADVHDPNPSNDESTAYLDVPAAADIYITITSNNNNPRVGETFTLTYKLGNNGPDTAENVTITIPIPDGFVISGISGDGTWIINGNNIIWTLENVTVGDPYLYVTGWTTQPGNNLFTASLASNTYNINSTGINSLKLNALPTANAATTTTIRMQNTGVPAIPLILALLMMIAGYAGTRKNYWE